MKLINLNPSFYLLEEKIDPEILAALEDAPVVPLTEDSDEVPVDDNFLEDDFFSKAGGVVPMEELKEEDEFEFSEYVFNISKIYSLYKNYETY